MFSAIIVTHAPAVAAAAPVATGSRIPDTVLSAIVAAVIALIGVGLSNWNSRRQVRMQLQHASKENQQQREMALRRDVYLPVAEAISRTQSALGLMSDLNEDAAAIGRALATDLATLAKAHVVASQETLGAILEFTAALTPAVIELNKLRMPMASIRSAIEHQDQLAKQANAQVQSFLQTMKGFNLHGNCDQPMWDRLQDLTAIEQRSLQTHGNNVQRLTADLAEHQLKLSARSSELAQGLAQLIPPILVNLRREINLSIDGDWYRSALERQQATVAKAMDDLLKEISAQVEAAKRPPTEP